MDYQIFRWQFCRKWHRFSWPLSTPPPSATISITTTKRPTPWWRASSCRWASDQGDNDRHRSVSDVDKVQLQQVVLVDTHQPTGAKVMAHCRARGRRNDWVPGGSAGVHRHITICAPRDAGVSPPSALHNRPGRESNPVGSVYSECGNPTSSSCGRSSQISDLRTVKPSMIF